jgi:hypothetical protein
MAPATRCYSSSAASADGVGWLFQVRDLSPRYHVITFENRPVGGPLAFLAGVKT